MGDRDGFALVETLVALAIAGMTIGTALQSFAEANGRIVAAERDLRRSNARIQAVVMASTWSDRPTAYGKPWPEIPDLGVETIVAEIDVVSGDERGRRILRRTRIAVDPDGTADVFDVFSLGPN